MTASEFRQTLRQVLNTNADRVLLRVALGPDLDRPLELTGRQILDQSTTLARQYTVAAPSEVVLILLPHSLELFLLHLGLVLEGRPPAILAWPTSRIDPEKYQRNLLHQLRNLPASQILTLPGLAMNLAQHLPYPATGIAVPGLEALEKTFRVAVQFNEDYPALRGSSSKPNPDALFLQFSGGTTGAQKAVVVTAPMLQAQLQHLRKALAFDSQDSVVSWLPMYHDMGLIACLWFPLWHGAPSLQFAAGDWLLNPELLFRYMERYRATFVWLPNFSFAYLASQRPRVRGRYSLEHVRAWINCSEPVRLKAIQSFVEAYANANVRIEQMQASYGMAENVFALTQTGLGEPAATYPRFKLKQRTSSWSCLAFDMLDDVYVSSGVTLEGMSVRIRNAEGGLCADAEPGEIQIQTASLCCGYWGDGGFAAHSVSQDGWYSTGDYGFLADQELFVIGRLKDIIIVGGQNIFPEDVEAIGNTVADIYPGRIVCFGVPDEEYGTESIAVVAEFRGDFDNDRALRAQQQIKQLVLTALNVAPRYVQVVPERWIVKSTAGKISRRDTRRRFLEERMAPQAR